MCDVLPTLTDKGLQAALGQEASWFDVRIVSQCNSTNALMLDLIRDPVQTGLVIIARSQTAGRGSRGRTWVSAPGACLAFSLLYRFSKGAEHMSGLSLAVGVAIARALSESGLKGVGLKWPNDILVGDRKLGGVLVELHADNDVCSAVIGVGVNLISPDCSSFTANALPPVALEDVMETPVDVSKLLGRVLVSLKRSLESFDTNGFEALRSEWLGFHLWQGRDVDIIRNGDVIVSGVCVGVDSEGVLLIETKQGLYPCISGDVSLREHHVYRN